MPAASDVGVQHDLIDDALAARPDLRPALERVLDGAQDAPAGQVVKDLRRHDAAGFDALARLSSGAYYLSPTVRQRIGYPGQPHDPPGPGEEEYDLRDGILDAVAGSRREQQPPTPLPLELFDAPVAEPSDVLVIGAGVAGSVAAWYLSAAGFRVTCLEQGPWVEPSQFPGERPDWELQGQGRWSIDQNQRGLPEDYPCETSGSDIAPVMFNAVGGSAIHFGAQWSRMRPQDFRGRSTDGMGDDWPISYAELQPYYERMDRAFAISGMGGNPAYPPGAPPPLPGFPLGRIGRRGAAGMNALGWHWWPADHAIASIDHASLRACVRLGTCLTGCPVGAKGTPDLTLWPAALERGARLVTGARVRRIEVGAHGRATGALYVDRDGVEHRARADVVVVAANGIGTPRLLLLSASPAQPDGLANSSGLVGRNLMLHPYVTACGLYDEPLESHRGPSGTPITSLQFADTDESRGFARGAQWDLFGTRGPIGVLNLWSGTLGPDRFGPRIHELMARTLGRSFQWGIGIEDLPSEANDVTLASGLADSDGIPAPRVRYRITDEARRNLAFQIARAREAHEAAGALETIVVDRTDSGWHLLGTCRMGDDAERSVVDRDGRAHDVENLYVIDGSVFVSSGPQPPTATIAANALRSVHALARNRRLQRRAV
jgi:choline dehydrogenase-like flavoprotein